MSLDANNVRLKKIGTVTILPAPEGRIQIVATGFEGEGASCRDVAAMAMVWAIGELQRELMRIIETPGGGSVGIG
jgi:hypothetical protein